MAKRLHQWLAVIFGLPFAVIALSGALLAFSDEIDRALNPDLRNVPPKFKQDTLPLQSYLGKASAQAVPVALYPPLTPYDSLRIDWLTALSAQQGFVRTEHYYNPYTGAALGSRLPETALPFLLAKVHRSFLLNKTGKNIAQAVVITGFFILLSGLWLSLKQARIAKTRHTQAGLWTFPILGVMLLTALISLYAPWHFPPSQRPAALPEHYPPETAQALFEAYQKLTPQLTRNEKLCKPPQKPRLILLRPDKTAHIYCQSTLDSGALTQTHWVITPSHVKHIPQTASNWTWALHTGSWLNLPGRMIWMWVSLAVLFLLYTGYQKTLRRLK